MLSYATPASTPITVNAPSPTESASIHMNLSRLIALLTTGKNTINAVIIEITIKMCFFNY